MTNSLPVLQYLRLTDTIPDYSNRHKG